MQHEARAVSPPQQAPARRTRHMTRVVGRRASALALLHAPGNALKEIAFAIHHHGAWVAQEIQLDLRILLLRSRVVIITLRRQAAWQQHLGDSESSGARRRCESRRRRYHKKMAWKEEAGWEACLRHEVVLCAADGLILCNREVRQQRMVADVGSVAAVRKQLALKKKRKCAKKEERRDASASGTKSIAAPVAVNVHGPFETA